MTRPKKVCAQPGCTTLLPLGVSRCPRHRLPKRGRQHRLVAATVVLHATVCAECGLPPTADDPLTGDHITPVVLGGRDVESNYRAVHRSCNSRNGAKIRDRAVARPDTETP